MNILVVDDSKIMRIKLKGVIGSAGIPVTSLLEAEHGREALSIIDRQPVDMVFTDINMPEMDGREFLRELWSRSLPQPIYRVVCTTQTPESLRTELNSYGVNLYVEKPFDADAIKQALVAAHAKRA